MLEQLLQARPGLPVIMMSGHGTIETAVRATRLGARDFLEKPIGRDRLLVALRNALEHRAAVEELETLRAEAGRYEMVGHGPAMQRLYHLVQRTAPSEGRVLITGENGTGKELVARALHRNSRRAAGPVRPKLNCAAVPHELIESELFGHEKGAFTGALALRRGKFELANGGTLFLDEVGDMPPTMQAKLLRVLQEREIERVGGTETLKVDVRVVAATNRDLEAEVAEGRFREDLYYRLGVVQIRTPPLRERREDLPDLIAAFLDEACRATAGAPLRLHAGGGGGALGARLPGQRPRAEEPGRAAGHPLRGPGGRPATRRASCCPAPARSAQRGTAASSSLPSRRRRRRCARWERSRSATWWTTRSGRSSSAPWPSPGTTPPRRPGCSTWSAGTSTRR